MEAGGHMTEEILSLTLEFIFLLTGERCALVKMAAMESLVHGMYPPIRMSERTSPSPTPQRANHDKILKVTNKMIQLLTKEVPMRCQDLAVYISMEEGEYQDEPHKAAMMQDKPRPPFQDDSGNAAERLPRCRTSQDSTGEGHMTPDHHHHQEGTQHDCNIFIKEEKEDEEEAEEDGHVIREVEFIDGCAVLYDDDVTEHDDKRRSCDQEEELLPGYEEEASLGEVDVSDDERGLKEEDLSLEITAAGLYAEQHPIMERGREDHGTKFSLQERILMIPPPRADPSLSNPLISDPSLSAIDFPRLSASHRHPKKLPRAKYVRPHLQTHSMGHSSKKPFSCPECGKCFSRKSQLLSHKRVHTMEKPFSCPVCGKYFSQKSNLIRHKIVHTMEKPYSCPQCGKCFSQKSNQIRHEAVHKMEKPFACLECGKSFSQKSGLVTHSKIHTGEKSYSCSQCGKCFSRNSILLKHKRVHVGEKPYSCAQCGLSYTTQAQLALHERVHSGEKPFSCSECGEHFCNRSALTIHAAAHRAERPYSCSQCGKSFAKRAHLVSHERVHTGEKTFTTTDWIGTLITRQANQPMSGGGAKKY